MHLKYLTYSFIFFWKIEKRITLASNKHHIISAVLTVVHIELIEIKFYDTKMLE